ncbi:hypothetical protein [Chryseobacterium sp. MYb328]|uniref:hypothetical protein n=1 Tax=Chryseobacterium sp. MYb328 TaxID=2745231 RepID=UPI0030A3C68B
MKTIQLFLLICILVSCKKENIYYYTNNKEIKDSTVIRFVDTELKKLDVDPKKGNLKIYTTLDSVSYKTNLDTIRTKVFELASKDHSIPKNRPLFDDWIKEKIIVVDNKTAKVVKFYSTFKNVKLDRDEINMIGMKKLIKLGSILNTNSEAEIPEDYLNTYASAVVPSDSSKIKENAVDFLSKFKIDHPDRKHYNLNFLSFQDAIKIFQTYNRNGVYKEPFSIKSVSENDKPLYTHKKDSINILSPISTHTIQDRLDYYKDHHYRISESQIKAIQNLYSIGGPTFHAILVNDGKYTYFIYVTSIVITDHDKKQSKMIPAGLMKKIGIHYYNAIRK